MAQTKALVQTLKRSLKAHDITYADVAKQLELSEASVKRLFVENSFSLARLDTICQMMDMEMTDLFKQMEEQSSKLEQLSVEQEQLISEDLMLLLIMICVLNRWTFKDIISFYHINEHQCIQKLALLDRLQIIDLLPKNRIKLKLAANFTWLKGGPIQQFFQQTIANEYFDSQFNEDNEKLLVLNGMLSHSANQEFQRKMQRLAHEFNELNQQDANLDIEHRDGITVVIGMRSWKYGLFKPLIKD